MLRLAIKQIKQIDNHCFQIKWNDDSLVTYRLGELQKKCPCAGCVGKTFETKDVRAISIKNIGRYALKIQFTSGCSAGIYDFSMLHHFC